MKKFILAMSLVVLAACSGGRTYDMPYGCWQLTDGQLGVLNIKQGDKPNTSIGSVSEQCLDGDLVVTRQSLTQVSDSAATTLQLTNLHMDDNGWSLTGDMDGKPFSATRLE